MRHLKRTRPAAPRLPLPIVLFADWWTARETGDEGRATSASRSLLAYGVAVTVDEALVAGQQGSTTEPQEPRR